MRLLRLDIHGFGRLRGRIDLDPGPGHVGLVLERNESGKSTLSAALLAALYGLEGDRRRFRGTITDVDRYRPWQGGAYGCTLTLRYGDDELVVERNFAEGSVRVLHGADDVTDQFQRRGGIRVGEGLTGLRREQFTASSFVGQGDIIWSDPSHLTEALQRVADSQSGKATAATALDALDRALAQYDGITLGQTGRVDTEIKRCEQALEELRQQLDQLERRKEEVDRRHGAAGAIDPARLWPNVRRDALRVRRMRRERAALEEVLAADIEVHERIAEQEGVLATEQHLDVLTDDAHVGIERLYRERMTLVPQVERARVEDERWRAEVERVRTEFAALGLRRVPTDEEVADLGAAVRRLQDAREERARFEQALEREKAELDAAGTDWTQALALSSRFEDLDDEQRVRLASRSKQLLEADERRRVLEDELGRARREIDVVAREQDRRRRVGLVVGSLGLVFAAVVFAFGTGWSDTLGLPVIAFWALAGLLLGVGVFRAGTAPRHRSREEELLRRRLEEAANALRGLEDDRREQDAAWQELADSLGVQADELEERYRQWRRIENRVSSLEPLRARVAEAEEDERRTLERLRGLVTLFDPPPGLEGLDDAVRRARHGVDLQRVARQAAEESARHQEAHREARLRREQVEDALVMALDEVGVHCDDPEGLGAALEEYARRRERAQERADLRERVLPALYDRRLDPEREAESRERAKALREQLPVLEASVRERAADEGERGEALVATLGESLGQSDFEREMKVVDAALDEERAHTERARAELRTFLERYGDEAVRLREEIDRHETALRRAREFRDAVSLARDTLKELGQQTHKVWAGQLNRHANELLRRMGSEVEDLRFDDTLAVQLRQRGRVITNDEVGRVLSAGAADAVFLAARLAVSRALGQDRVSLPLVLDDPLANADDDRLLASLRLLIDAVAPQQQVLLMACQHSRYDWAQAALERPGALTVLRLSEDGATGS